MATTLTTNYESVATGTLYWSYSGNSHNASLKIEAKYDYLSATTARIYYKGFVKCNTITWVGTNKGYSYNSGDSGSHSDTLTQNTWVALPETYIDVNIKAATFIEFTYRVMSASQAISVYVEAPGSAPTGLNATNIVRGIEGFTADVSVSGWGHYNSNNYANRYIELQVWTYDPNNLVTPRRWRTAPQTSSATITVDNTTTSGTLTIVGNTMYTLGKYAYNGTEDTGSQRVGNYTTIPPKDTLTFNSSDSESITVDYSVPVDGGQYPKTLEYSVDGTNWVTYDTISNGNAKTGTFTISNLEPNTVYTIQSRVSTQAGTTVNDNITGQTIGPATPTVSGARASANTITWTYGTTTFGGGLNGLVKLYSSSSVTPGTVVDTYAQTGNTTYTTSALVYNAKYYARARAQSDFDGETVYSDYSDTVMVATLPQDPVINAIGVKEYETVSTVQVRANIGIGSDYDDYDKALQYRVKIDSGSWSSFTTATTITSGAAQTFNLDISDVPVSVRLTLQVKLVTAAGETNVAETYIDVSGVHQGPTDFDWALKDNNTSLQTWLSGFSGYTDPVYVQGKSQAKVIIPRASEGTTSDNTSLVKYVASIPSESASLNIAWVSGVSDMEGTFSAGIPAQRSSAFPSNLITVNTSAYDSLDAYTTVSKNVIVLSYESPTLQANSETIQAGVKINFEGSYARLQDNALNSGNDLNSIQLEYRVLAYDGTVITPWTSLPAPTRTVDSDSPFLMNYSGNFTIPEQVSLVTVEVKVADHFEDVTVPVVVELWEKTRIVHVPEYEIELWDWKTSTFVADISYLVIGEINIEWTLNDVEEVSFSLDLLRYEEKCQEMGVDSTDLLVPYAHDIRIRRNGEYILGCQLVEVDIQLSNNPPAKINCKGTGFLNLFKDQYVMHEAWSGYTYSEIMKKLVEYAQKPDCLVKNPTIDIDTSYWLAAQGTIAYSTASKEGDGCIMGSRSGTGWVTYGIQMDTDTGDLIDIDVWVKGQSGRVCYLREREYITTSNTQQTPGQITLDGTWQRIQVSNYMTSFEKGYLVIEVNRTDSTNLYVDECRVYHTRDEDALCDMGVRIGTDTASSLQSATRQVNYELQNVKDAMMELVEMEEDNFDFEFLPDRTLNIYARKGTDNLDLDITYPGNVYSMTINRSASNLANKVIGMGSGIGDERLQKEFSNNTSRARYGTHEHMFTSNNTSLESELISKTVTALYDKKDPTNLPKIEIKDGSVNPSNIQTGDVIALDVDGVDYIKTVTGEYRVSNIDLSVSEDGEEEMTITVEPPLQRPQKRMIRYIRDSVGGSTTNTGSYWTEIQALMLVGNDYVNVALGKTVTASNSNTARLEKIVDGNYGDSSQDSGNYAGTTVVTGTSKDAVTIDLGDEYPIDYIQVWHWYRDGRSFYNNTLSVGTELVGGANSNQELEEVLWQYNGQAYVETSKGKRSYWLQERSITYDEEES